MESQISPRHYPCQKEIAFTTQSFIKGIPSLSWRGLSKYYWSTESLVPYLPSNLLFLKKAKLLALFIWNKWREGAHRSASLYLQWETPVFWSIFPCSWKLLIWLPSPPLALCDTRFSLTSVRMTFRSWTPWLSLGPLLACLFFWDRARAPPFQTPNRLPQLAIYELLKPKSFAF